MPNEDFNRIKLAAVVLDPVALRDALRRPIYPLLDRPAREYVSIDLRKEGSVDLTPAAELALQGNHLAVVFLRSRGADINYIAAAYAQAHDEEMVDQCLSLGASVNFIAGGYARGGWVDKAWEYLELSANINFIVKGFAAAGLTNEVDRCIREFDASVNEAIFAYALAGNHEQVDRLASAHPNNPDYPAEAYAIAGDVGRAYRYVRNDVVGFSTIGKGFARGGHKIEAERCRRHGGLVSIIAQGYAMAGDVAMANHYRRVYHADVNIIASGFATRRHTYQALRYIRKYHADPATLVTWLIVAGYSELSNFYAREIRVQTNNPMTITYPPAQGSDVFSKELKKFVEELEENPIKIVEGYAYEDHGEELCCAIGLVPPKIPVILNGHLYDLDALKQWYISDPFKTDPQTRKPFTFKDIEPSPSTVTALNKIAASLEEKPKEKTVHPAPLKA